MIASALVHIEPSAMRPLPLDDWRIAIDDESQAKRRDVIAARGLPGSAVGGLQRVTPYAADPRFLLQLAATLKDPSVLKLFNHAPAIGPDLLRIFSDERLLSRVTSRFIKLVSESDKRRREAYFAPMLEAALVLFELGESRGGTKVAFTSPEKLEESYHLSAHHVAPEDVERVRHCRFKPAPVNGIPGFIEQIQTGEDLLGQAIAMQQCCAGEDYVAAMKNDYTFLFRAGGFGLSRCTIEVTAVGEDDNGVRRYAITQVAGRCNEALDVPDVDLIVFMRVTHSRRISALVWHDT